MLLTHIDVLIKEQKEIKYSCQLYEEMIEKWIEREANKVEKIEKEALRNFSDQLAMDLFLNRKDRGSEKIPKDELSTLAQQWQIPLDDWQLTGRSLLNRDAVGNYKFAHRSIMEYLFVKHFLGLPRDQRLIIAWTDQMYKFLHEMLQIRTETGNEIPDLYNVNLREIGKLSNRIPRLLRSKKKELSKNDVEKMIKEFDFFDASRNKRGRGIEHDYQELRSQEEEIVFDLSTGLMWQKSGS